MLCALFSIQVCVLARMQCVAVRKRGKRKNRNKQSTAVKFALSIVILNFDYEKLWRIITKKITTHNKLRLCWACVSLLRSGCFFSFFCYSFYSCTRCCNMRTHELDSLRSRQLNVIEVMNFNICIRFVVKCYWIKFWRASCQTDLELLQAIFSTSSSSQQIQRLVRARVRLFQLNIFHLITLQ